MITLSIALKGGGRKRAVLAIIRSVAVAAEFHLLDAKLYCRIDSSVSDAVNLAT
jgi:hypothetical protein